MSPFGAVPTGSTANGIGTAQQTRAGSSSDGPMSAESKSAGSKSAGCTATLGTSALSGGSSRNVAGRPFREPVGVWDHLEQAEAAASGTAFAPRKPKKRAAYDYWDAVFDKGRVKKVKTPKEEVDATRAWAKASSAKQAERLPGKKRRRSSPF